MRFQKYLQEEFAGSRKMNIGSIEMDPLEFFKNPNSKEIKIAYKASGSERSIRFYIDFKRKEVIIWQGNIVHSTAINLLDPKKHVRLNDFILGAAEPDKGKMKIISENFEIYASRFLSQLIIAKSWLSKYFSNINELVDLLKISIKNVNNYIIKK